MSEGPVSTAHVKIEPDLTGFAAELQREIQQALNQARGTIATGLNGINNQFNSMSANAGAQFNNINRGADRAASGMASSFKKAAGIAVAAFAGIQVGQFFVDAVGQAADLGESINAIQVVLKSGSASFLEFGKNAATQLGITQNALNEAITPTAALLAGAGSSGEDLSSQLQLLATRATDVGSVFNKDVNEVLLAFGSALRGETEPIRAVGVQLNEQSIAAKAVALGLAESTTAVSQAAKTQAAYAIILEKTKFAQGDFQNTITSLPNLIKVVKAQFDTVAADLGTALIPALQQVIQGIQPIIQSLGPVLAQIGGALAQVFVALGPAIQSLVPILTQVVGVIAQTLLALQPALQPLVAAIGSIVNALAPLLPVIGQLIATAVAPLAQIIDVLAQALAPLIAQLLPILSSALEALKPVFAAIVDAVSRVLSVLGPALGTVIAALAPIFGQLVAAIGPLVEILANSLADILVVLAPLLANLLVQLLPLIPTIIDLALALVPLIPPIIQLAVTLLPLLAGAISLLLKVIVPVANAIAGVFIGALQGVVAFVAQVVNLINDAIGSAIDLYNKIPFLGNVDKPNLSLGTPLAPGAPAAPVAPLPKPVAPKIPTPNITAAEVAGSASGGIGGGAAAAGKKLASEIKKASEAALKDATALAKKTADQSVDEIRTAFDKLYEDLREARQNSFIKGAKEVEARLLTVAKRRDRTIAQLEKATDALADLRQEALSFNQSIRDSITDLGNVTAPTQGLATTFLGIKNNLRTAVASATEFGALIKNLSAQGLNQESLRQLVEAGPEGGIDAARALATAGASGIAEINALQANLQKQAISVSDSITSTFYSAGISAAQGLVSGLQSQEAAIEAQMNRIGDKLVKQLRRALKIQSPSLVLAREVGVPSGQGIIKGLTETLNGAIGGAGSQSVRSYASNVTFGPGSIVAHGATEASAQRMGTGLGYGVSDVVERELARAMLNGTG